MASSRKLAAIMFTDIEGYTALMQRSEREALKVREKHRRIFDSITEDHNGKIIQYYGDGTLSIFDSTVDAVRCGRDLQRAFLSEPVIPVRIGIHTGDIVLSDQDIIGDSVNLASRVESMGIPGSVLVSGKVAEEIRNQEDFRLVLLGRFRFKNDDKKREIFALDDPGLVIPKKKDLQGKVAKPGWKGQLFRPPALVGMVMVLLVLAGTWLYPKIFSHRADELAVLPLINFTNVDEGEQLVNGLHIALVTELQKVGLVTRGITSMLRYRNTTKSVREIAKELAVGLLIEGSVFRADDKLGMNLSMIDGRNEHVIWTRSFEEDFRDVGMLYRKVIGDVADEIQMALNPHQEERLNKQQQVNPQAYKAYLTGKQYWYELTRESLDMAERYFQRALEYDPEYGPAHAGIAAVWGGRLQQGMVSYSDTRETISDAMREAIKYGSDLAEVQFWRGAFNAWWDWNWEDAEKAFEKSIELNPNSPETHAYYSHYLLTMKRPEEAMVHVETAVEQDPFNQLIRAIYGMALNFSRNYDRAIQIFEDPTKQVPDDPIALSTLRTSYHLTKQYDKAIVIWERSYMIRRDTVAANLVHTAFAKGGYHYALEKLAEFLIERSRNTYVTPWQIATLYTRAGKNGKAMDWLEGAYLSHDSNMPYISIDPIFDDLRDDPRFISIMKTMGLPLGELED